MPNGASDPFSDELVEKMAAMAHQSWAGWMLYLFSKSHPTDDGALVIPASSVERWRRQMTTLYADLPENEKESDREEARRYLRALIPPIVVTPPEGSDHPWYVARRSRSRAHQHHVLDAATLSARLDQGAAYDFLVGYPDEATANRWRDRLNTIPEKEDA